MTIKINKMLIILILFTILMSIPATIFATGDLNNVPIDKVVVLSGDKNNPLNNNRTVSERAAEMFPNKNGELDGGLPNVTINDASNWMERKGFEIIGFMQKFIQPFAIIIFILSAIMLLAGCFGNGKLLSKGFLGMFISLIMYVVVLYAPEIMDVFLNWVQS